MKKTLLFLILAQCVFLSIQAQTHYGTGAGSAGTNHSYFGYYAGNASTSYNASNSFFGAYCGRNTTTGASNTAAGSFALYYNIVGRNNTAVGVDALYNNTDGYFSVAIGTSALFEYNKSYYSYNTANGFKALYSGDGSQNTATGALALRDNTNGTYNIATGFQSLYNNTTGSSNVATGAYAMEANTTGDYNSAYGVHALSKSNGSYNSAFGLHAENTNNCVGSYNTAFGAYAGFAPDANCNLNNTTALGYNTRVTGSNQVRIGNSDVTSIGGQVSWSILSDGRFKKDLKKDVAGLDFINLLNPVSYTVDKDAFDKFLGIVDSLQIKHTEGKRAPQHQIGFIAQEVDAVVKKSGYVFSGVESPQNEKDFYTIRYAEFVVPLTKAIQELSVIGDASQKEIAELKETLHQYMEEIPIDETSRSNSTAFETNPHSFSEGAEIHIELTEGTAQANLIIYNLEGKELKDILVHERGNITVKISRNDLNPGMYLYALIADDQVAATNKITLKER